MLKSSKTKNSGKNIVKFPISIDIVWHITTNIICSLEGLLYKTFCVMQNKIREKNLQINDK